mmetsp:Transcript_24817/g.78734  ORF Transcript_24817/g.78734 Transcript_24817/m.78734 type:complete len:284 (+) Transcript_24817:877-1728(+)
MMPPPAAPAAAAARQRCSSSTPIGWPSRSSAPASAALVHRGAAEGAPAAALAFRRALCRRSADKSTGSPSTSSSRSKVCAEEPVGGALATEAAASLRSAWPFLEGLRAQYSSNERSRPSSVALVAGSSLPPPPAKPRLLQCRSRVAESMAANASSLDRTAGSCFPPERPPCSQGRRAKLVLGLKTSDTSGLRESRGAGARREPAPGNAEIVVGGSRAPPNTMASSPCRRGSGKTSQARHAWSTLRTAASAVGWESKEHWPLPSAMPSRSLRMMPGRASWNVWR